MLGGFQLTAHYPSSLGLDNAGTKGRQVGGGQAVVGDYCVEVVASKTVTVLQALRVVGGLNVGRVCV